ncbi:MAG: hypothetical protein IJP61_01995 [Treponema sp.]|nr:hypothetical protein [Treponema sp.]
MSIKRVFKTACVVFIFILAFSFVCAILRRYDSYAKFRSYFKDKTDYDVLFLGTSHVLNGVNPMQLWNEYGITSYNMGWNCNTIPADYWQLRLAAGKTKPKVAVIDILGLYDDIKVDYSSNYVFVHGILDQFPLSTEKTRAICDLFDSKKTRFEFFLPFTLYHNRWQEFSLKKIRNVFNDYILDKTPEIPTKGFDPKIGVRVPQSFLPYIPEYVGRETVAIAYARKIIAYCRENGIIPVFMHIPFSEQEKTIAWKKAFEKIIAEEKVDFIDMSSDVDFEIDQYDTDFHLNISGAGKITSVIGSYLREKCGLKAHDDERTVSKWKSDYESYQNYYDSLIKNQTDISLTLLLLSNSDYKAQALLANGFDFSVIQKKQIKELGLRFFEHRLHSHGDFDCSIKIFREKDDSLVCEKFYRKEFITEIIGRE